MTIMAKVRVLNNGLNPNWNSGDEVELEGKVLDENLKTGAVVYTDDKEQEKYLKSQVEHKPAFPEAPKVVKDAFNEVTKKVNKVTQNKRKVNKYGR